MEKDFKREVILSLSDHFHLFPEVKGTHFTGKRFSLDHVIKPKNNIAWKTKDIAFGIEYKDLDRIDGDTKNFTSWIAQCNDYANTNWDNFGYIYVLTCPGIDSRDFMKSIDKDKMLNKLMSQLGIGELKKLSNYGWSIVMQDTHRMWSEKKGIESGKHWNLKRKFGSR